MKNLILFTILSTLLLSCGGSGGNPDSNITLGQAFSHVTESFEYWLFVVLSIIPTAAYLVMYAKGKLEEVDLRVLFFLLAIILFAIFFRPCEVAVNTTVDQAARGVYIGY